MKMRTSFCAVVFFLVSACSGFAQSIGLGPRAGLYLEDADFYAGGEADITLISVEGLHILPSIDFIFTDEGPGNIKLDSKWLFSVNAIYDIVPLVFGTFYAGGGVGFFRNKFDTDKTKDTDTALNLITGIRYDNESKVIPFSNLRVTINDNDSSVILEGGFFFTIF